SQYGTRSRETMDRKRKVPVMRRSPMTGFTVFARRLPAVGCAVLVAGMALAGAPAEAAVAPAPALTHTAVPRPPQARAVRVAPGIVWAERAASATARSRHKGVLVTAETTPSSEVTANPDGTFTLTASSSPV